MGRSGYRGGAYQVGHPGTYEIVQPDGTADMLPVALRRAIGLVRLGGDDRSDRDLRLVQGSALDRLLSDKTLRSRIATKLSTTEVQEELSDNAKKALEDLDDVFTEEKPSRLCGTVNHRQPRRVRRLDDWPYRLSRCRHPAATFNLGRRHQTPRRTHDCGAETGREGARLCGPDAEDLQRQDARRLMPALRLERLEESRARLRGTRRSPSLEGRLARAWRLDARRAQDFSPSALGNTFEQEVSEGCAKPRKGRSAAIQELARCVLQNPNHRGVASMLRRLADRRASDPAFSGIEFDSYREFKEAIRLGDFADVEAGLG